MRRWVNSLFMVAVLLAAAFASGCGGGGGNSGEKANVPRMEGRTSTQAPKRPASQRAESKKSKAALLQAAAAGDRRADRELRARHRVSDAKAGATFKKTPFDKLIDKLPIRSAPLYVEQFITTEGSHTLYTAVAKQRFLCSMSAQQRLAAVQAFYRDASKVFRSGGVNDFVQVVTPQAETTDKLPALAVAKAGSVSLTKLGRGGTRC